jgi:hypothetical protein
VEGLRSGDAIVFHAAAGGVGLIACQWGKALGLEVIATAGSEAKCALALEHGAAHAINYRGEDWVARVKQITGGAGVKVVYDSVGKDTFEGSLNVLRPLGLLASFGNASGPVPPFAPGLLGPKGSLYLTRATLFTHIATQAATQAMAEDLFAVVQSGAVKIRIDQRFALADVAQAHRALEARETTGSTTLPTTRSSCIREGACVLLSRLRTCVRSVLVRTPRCSALSCTERPSASSMRTQRSAWLSPRLCDKVSMRALWASSGWSRCTASITAGAGIPSECASGSSTREACTQPVWKVGAKHRPARTAVPPWARPMKASILAASIWARRNRWPPRSPAQPLSHRPRPAGLARWISRCIDSTNTGSGK